MNKAFNKKAFSLSQLYRTSIQMNLFFNELKRLIKESADDNRIDRKIRRYGSYFDWQSAHMDIIGLTVNECSMKDGEILRTRTFVSIQEVPVDKRHFWAK